MTLFALTFGSVLCVVCCILFFEGKKMEIGKASKSSSLSQASGEKEIEQSEKLSHNQHKEKQEEKLCAESVDTTHSKWIE